MKRGRARWVLGLSWSLAAVALSCSSAETEQLFSSPSPSDAGGSNFAGATNNAGGESGNATAGAPSEAFAGHAGVAQAGKGGATGGASAAGAGSGGAAGAPINTAGGGGLVAGSGGASGSAGTAASAGMAGSGGGAGTGGALCVDNQACKVSEYCAKSTCQPKAEGHCSVRPKDCADVNAATVCGCDGITYHDSCLLHLNGQNSGAVAGACVRSAAGTLTCTSLDDTACTDRGGICAFRADGACGVEPVESNGICWVLPESCPSGDDHAALLCNIVESACTSECEATQTKQRYVLPGSCN